MRTTTFAFLSVVLLLTGVGCTPATVAVQVGMYMAGRVVDDVDADQLGQKLIGQPPAAADAELGPRNDTFNAINRPVTWISYPVKLDVLKQNQYFVEVRNGRITRIEKMEGSANEVDIARSTFDKTQVAGKSPAECQAILNAGPPELEVRSQNTGKLMQFYNGAFVVDVGDKKYIILRFDLSQRCERLQIVDVAAAS